LAQENTINHSLKYAIILNLNEIKGWESGRYVETVIKK
jgi:hypothetical protein